MRSSAEPGFGELLGGWQLDPPALTVLLGAALLYGAGMRRARGRVE